MLRSSVIRVHTLLKSATGLQNGLQPLAAGSTRFMSKENTETDAQFDQRYENFFNNPEIDGWDVRRGVTDLLGHDLVPEPKILIAALKACRRNDDLALAVRILEALKSKCGSKVNEIYPWYIQEIRPTLAELGVPTPEELGYDKPELALENVDDM